MLIAVFILSFMMTPLKSIWEIDRNSMNKKMHSLGIQLAEKYNIRGNIASNRQKKQFAVHDSWHRTFRLAYWLQSRYYGQDREDISEKDLQSELQKFDIDYYFYWDSAAPAPRFLSQYKEVTNAEIPGLRIYSLNKKR
jgi:hypothetical protein